MAAGELPTGTVRWSVPTPAIPGYDLFLKAQPLEGGPDLLAVLEADSSTLVTGLTADGQALWTANVNVRSGCSGWRDPVTDGFGGVLVCTQPAPGRAETYSFIDVDGQTGAQAWRYDSGSGAGLMWPAAIGPDGTIYLVDELAWIRDPVMRLVVLDGGSGLAKFIYTPPFGSEIYSWGTERTEPIMAAPVIGPDGAVFSAVLFRNYNHITNSYSHQLSLLRLGPDGSTTLSPFNTVFHDYTTQLRLNNIIPDGNGGAFVSWRLWGFSGPPEGHLTHVTASGATDRVLGANQIWEMVLGENGVIFASDLSTVTACRADTLAPLWSYTRPAGPGSVDLVVATADGGVIVNDSGSVVPLDSTGAPGPAYPDGTPWAGSDWIDVIASGNPAGTAWQPLSADQRTGARARNGRPRRPSSSVAPLGAGTATPAFALFVSLNAVIAATLCPYSPACNYEVQNRVQRPRLSVFIPVDPGGGLTSSSARDQIVSIVNHQPDGSADITGVSGARANVASFLDALASHRDAVAFIGHSAVWQRDDGIFRSVGLLFSDAKQALLRTPDSGDPELAYGGTSWGPDYTTFVRTRIDSDAKVLFFGACDLVGKAFLSLWGIDSSTRGRALVLPESAEHQGAGPYLRHAVNAWVFVAIALDRGDSVQQAVDQANAAMRQQSFPERWTIIGDGNVRLIRKSNQ